MSDRPIHDSEAKWQEKWEKEGVYRAEDRTFPDQPHPNPLLRKERGSKFYGLIEFPYPSGDGLHVGHPRSFTAIDIFTRKRRMEGKNVLYPIGWDAFGLPTENYAIKTKTAPAIVTAQNIANFTRQLKSLGLGFDWSREVSTADPAYYKWTQWQFLQFVKAGLAYKAKSTINWCPKDKIGLANEEAQGGVCERCGTAVEKREKEQWMIKITKYAERLLKDLDTVDYLDRIKTQQVNWIGKSEGATIRFQVSGFRFQDGIEVFTTRPDTISGATFLVIAPEMAEAWMRDGWEPSEEVEKYVAMASRRSEQERAGAEREKGGVSSGLKTINPATKKEIPIWIADYVLASYGTGAIMAVPAHDERDDAFAKKFHLPGIFVCTREKDWSLEKAVNRSIEWLEKEGVGKRATTYKLRDWVFSRQRYWGEPIPLVHCESCAKKKQKVLLIHGFEGSAESNWFPWMKQELEKHGFEVFLPTLPDSSHPKFEEWMAALEPIIKQFGEDDIIVGHSLGGRSILHLLSRLKKRIGHVYLIAPAVWEKPLNWNEIKKDPNWEGSDVDTFRVFHDHAVSWEDARPYADRKTIIFSDDDPYVPVQDHSTIPAGWFIQTLHQKGHFNHTEYPELLELILQSKNTGWIPLPDDQLPLKLPEVEAYEPTDTGESPLAKIRLWVETTCPKCGGKAERETDTMPNWAGSSWYFLRYCDPHNDREFASPEKLKYWMPVDLYNGGMEHTTLHLLYSRFWHKFLWDMGYVPHECGSEPYRSRRSHGLILAQGGEKMSKSKGNVVNPDDVVAKYGADVFRIYEMFMGPFDQAVPWDTNGIEGVKRFLDKVWGLFNVGAIHELPLPDDGLQILYHQTVKKITDGIDQLQFNTCVSQLMILTNGFQDAGGVPEEYREGYLKLLAPFAPHLTEEIWRTQLSHK
ncbi:MAG: alpha/beta fold hydrolase, partial [Candidatus Uhrbacteria bacterium]|nr:alpha/beta fold hydrolase [Candidatus Uhrbacteria bacterium]